MFGLFNRSEGVDDPVAKAGDDAYGKALSALNGQLKGKVGRDSLSKGTALARAARARNPAYAVFAIPYK
jgi:hypothetical protein